MLALDLSFVSKEAIKLHGKPYNILDIWTETQMLKLLFGKRKITIQLIFRHAS